RELSRRGDVHAEPDNVAHAVQRDPMICTPHKSKSLMIWTTLAPKIWVLKPFWHKRLQCKSYQRQGRVSYRALKRRFTLDDDYLEDLKAELIDAQQLATDEEGKVLVWTGRLATAERPAGSQGRAPRAYTPTHLAEKILLSKAALEGERKQVTVLFADLKG